MTPERHASTPATTLYLFAFLSGMAALVYQVAWTKMLTLTFGRTTLAAGAVVGGFMAGMGIGAWLYHRAQGGRLNAIRLYASLEIGIALATALLTLGFSALPDLFVAVSGAIPAGLHMSLFRVGFVLVILLLPAALMGATYPALCAVLIRTREDAGRHLGPIYGLNTVGAAIGALIAGFVLVEQLGLRGSVWAANLINLAVGVAAWQVGRSASSDAYRPATLNDANALLPTCLPRRITAVVLFGSGFATLAYEIVWFRALRYLFGNSTYAFTIMLVVFLLGLGLGGILCGRERWRSSPERNLAICQLGIAVLAMIAMTAETLVLVDQQLSSSISIFSKAVPNLPWWRRLLTDLFVGLALLLPATLLMGISFPLATRLYLGDLRWLGKRVGSSYLLANLGAIGGSVAAALLILPHLGTIGGTRAIAALNAMLGFLVLSRLPWGVRRRLAWCLGALAVLWSTSFLILPARLPFRTTQLSGSLQMELMFEEEGDIATVQVWSGRDHPERRWISVDGTSIGETRGFSRSVYGKQILLAHLPMALDPEIRSTLNIGLGSASTLNALASYPTVQNLDVVEISAAVARGSRLFDESEVLADPRVRLVVEDIAHYLLRGTKRYDLIISDGKLGSDFSGNAMMLCRDFYAYASRRLSKAGLFIQWIPLDHARNDFEIILRTFLESFPEVELFFEDPGSVFLVGSRSPISGRRDPDAEQFVTKRVKQDFKYLRIPRVDALLARWTASGAELRSVVGKGPISTWNHSVIEYSIYRSTHAARLRSMGSNLTLILDANVLTRGNPFLPSGSPFEISTALTRKSRWESYRSQFTRARRLAERAVDANPDDPHALALLREFRGLEER